MAPRSSPPSSTTPADLCVPALMNAFGWPCDCEGPNPSSKSSSNVTVANFPSLASPHGVVGTLGMAAPGMALAAAEADRFCLPRAAAQQFENWGDSVSGIVVSSPLTETSTDLGDSGEKHHALMGCGGGAGTGAGGGAHSQRRVGCVDSSERTGDEKTARRLAQNREAARKSRIRKKAYLSQLETSRSKLTHLEQELQRARQQGIFIAGGGSGDCSSGGALAFDLEYARWLDDHQRHINNLRVAVIADISDDELRILVESVLLHHDEFFRLKNLATKADVFHVLSGMWMSPAERFFMWLGGFRSSEILKVLASHLEPLTDQQLMGICNLQQSSQQAEDALSQGMEALQQALAETLAAAAGGGPLAGADNVTNYMGQMAIAMGKLSTLENFLRQGDLLRQQTLQQMHRILTTRQAARALLVISDYFSRLRALSSLWLARPRD
ncbi:transcription factor TGAL3-like isoform X2 [Hordeum vulgare subsp. vulgare]|uniref:transcription factor TGAL3-like isoform X2 n=1 Tax=Hordeum vulgare subsp. vulgare TaxID=112509 RepID=UPI001D1A3787|nr:transcription factor TGAL3-like isoform X2 [Hordeum vulgare subsp. vulgare]